MSQKSSNSSILNKSCVGLILILILIQSNIIYLNNVEAKPLQQYQVKFRSLPPKEFSAAIGSSITIDCEAGASPPPTIHWLKNGKRVHVNEFDDNQLDDLGQTIQVDDVNRIALSATRSRLFIDCADLRDEATYTCVAENSYSRISSHTKLNLIRPAVQSVASSVASASQLGANGERDEDNTLSELSSVGAVEAALKPEAAATTSRSTASAAAAATAISNLALSAVPQCLSDRYLGRVSPRQVSARIHMWTHNIVEIMKNNVILYCRSNVSNNRRLPQVSGKTDELIGMVADKTTATNKISWTLPNDKLVGGGSGDGDGEMEEEHKNKYEILETGDLLIKDLQWSDMGSYVCTVSNENNSDSVSTFVYPASVKLNTNTNNNNNNNNNNKRIQQIR